MKGFVRSKKNITRIILLFFLVFFGILWNPQSESTRIGQYFLIGNIILIIALMETLPLWFKYYYRDIISLLEHFAQSYDTPLSYSYTPVVVIKSNISNTNSGTYLVEKKTNSDTSFLTIYHNNNLYEFTTDILNNKKLDTLASVIIYYLQDNIPYEILYQHSKRINHILK